MENHDIVILTGSKDNKDVYLMEDWEEIVIHFESFEKAEEWAARYVDGSYWFKMIDLNDW